MDFTKFGFGLDWLAVALNVGLCLEVVHASLKIVITIAKNIGK